MFFLPPIPWNLGPRKRIFTKKKWPPETMPKLVFHHGTVEEMLKVPLFDSPGRVKAGSKLKRFNRPKRSLPTGKIASKFPQKRCFEGYIIQSHLCFIPIQPTRYGFPILIFVPPSKSNPPQKNPSHPKSPLATRWSTPKFGHIHSWSRHVGHIW